MASRMMGRIRKAIIPVAGLGTRLMPATRAIPKPMLPIIDSQGQSIPLIQHLVEEAISSGIEHVGLIISPSQRSLFEMFFHEPVALRLSGPDHRRNPGIQIFRRRMLKFACRVEFITQHEPGGFGDAVYRSRAWIGGEPFLLMLGDYLYRSRNQIPCARQVMDCFFERKISVTGIARSPISYASQRGAVAGIPYASNSRRRRLTRIVEKPSIETAHRDLRCKDLQDDQLFTMFGCYAFTPGIFRVLDEDIVGKRKSHGEIQLTDAMDRLRRREGLDGFEVDGESRDAGNPKDYRNAIGFLYYSRIADDPTIS